MEPARIQSTTKSQLDANKQQIAAAKRNATQSSKRLNENIATIIRLSEITDQHCCRLLDEVKHWKNRYADEVQQWEDRYAVLNDKQGNHQGDLAEKDSEIKGLRDKLSAVEKEYGVLRTGKEGCDETIDGIQKILKRSAELLECERPRKRAKPTSIETIRGTNRDQDEDDIEDEVKDPERAGHSMQTQKTTECPATKHEGEKCIPLTLRDPPDDVLQAARLNSTIIGIKDHRATFAFKQWEAKEMNRVCKGHLHLVVSVEDELGQFPRKMGHALRIRLRDER
ncbi:uncharacterized protein LTR77_008088 [Saxophila tyrrhenica]|uniref:Uncharacterized protein n=1 Tax=Saxophila tyrrhenica TaxID=1690608 RepID=A0AAV9P1S1_9PEZI|nr:hypothetical protein LTR77_008088 [Saxophila tyrrhenica]